MKRDATWKERKNLIPTLYFSCKLNAVFVHCNLYLVGLSLGAQCQFSTNSEGSALS